MTVSGAFEKMTTALELTPNESNKASQQCEFLRASLREQLNVERDFISGSYARSTAIRPLDDIDLFLVLGKQHAPLQQASPDGVLRLVQRAIKRIYPTAELPIRQNRSVHIAFAGTGIGYDVVPAFAEGAYYLIPDRDSGRWIRSNPERHQVLSTAANEAANKKLKPLVKVAKHWNRRQPAKAVRSFHLEVMAGGILRGFTGSYAEGLAHLFAGLASAVMGRCPEPAGLGADLDSDLSAAERRAAGAAFGAAAQQARQALELGAAGRTEEAHHVWRSLLGAEYPEAGRAPRPTTPTDTKPAPDHPRSRFG